jgi:hypothetical protein
MDYRLALMTGVDIPIPECQLTLHQPRIKEISMMGETEFFTGAQCLCIDKRAYIQDESLLSQTTNFQIMMTVLDAKENADKKAMVQQLLTILFPTYKIMFTPRSLMFNHGDENIIIDEDNFESLQAIFQKVFCLSDSGQESFNPGNEAAKKIADKLMRARQKVAQEKQKAAGDGSIFTQYLSMLTVGLQSMSLQDLISLTMYQLYDLVERFMLFTNWDLDIKQRLAGGKPDSSPDN